MYESRRKGNAGCSCKHDEAVSALGVMRGCFVNRRLGPWTTCPPKPSRTPRPRQEKPARRYRADLVGLNVQSKPFWFSVRLSKLFFSFSLFQRSVPKVTCGHSVASCTAWLMGKRHSKGSPIRSPSCTPSSTLLTRWNSPISRRRICWMCWRWETTTKCISVQVFKILKWWIAYSDNEGHPAGAEACNSWPTLLCFQLCDHTLMYSIQCLYMYGAGQ